MTTARENIIPEDRRVCQCGEKRLLFRNYDGLVSLACPVDDIEDILRWLQCKYPDWMNMKTCPTCGSQVSVLITKLETGRRFCYHCGGGQ